MKAIVTFTFLASVWFFSITDTVGQSSLNYTWYANVNGGLSQMYGDVQNNNNHISKLNGETGFGIGTRVGRYLNPLFAVHFQFLKANFKGDKDKYDLHFSSDLMEFQLGTTVNLLNFLEKKERRLNLYATVGVGTSLYRSEAFQSDGTLAGDYGYSENEERSKTGREVAFVLPIGMGIDFHLMDRWYVNGESVLRLSGSDEMDAIVSGSRKDAYFYTSLGVTYHFGEEKQKEIFIPEPVIAEKQETLPVADYINFVYNFPENLKSFQEFEMKCRIHKGNIKGRGELVQILPKGFNIQDSTIENARMEFKNYTLNIFWDELPSDSVFEISYHVVLDRIYGNLPLTSILYFEQTGKDYKFKTNIFIERAEKEEDFLADERFSASAIDSALTLTDSLPTDLEFRVQIRAAYKAQIPLQNLADKYNLHHTIIEDFEGNWYRYSVGSFSSLYEAKQYRKEIMGKHGVRDAFVVAYYNGERLNGLSELKQIVSDADPVSNSYKENGRYYRVQILALKQGSVSTQVLKEMYSLDEDINEEIYTNWRKYTVGKCTSFSEAKALMTKLKAQGLTDTFIVTYKNGERVVTK